MIVAAQLDCGAVLSEQRRFFHFGVTGAIVSPRPPGCDAYPCEGWERSTAYADTPSDWRYMRRRVDYRCPIFRRHRQLFAKILAGLLPRPVREKPSIRTRVCTSGISAFVTMEVVA